MNLPPPAMNADSKEFWEGARENRLLIKQCDSCSRRFFPPRYVCPFCWSEKTSWIESGGSGSIYSYTVIHRPPTAAFSDRAPYVVALVELAEGPRVMANIVGAGARDVKVGDPVRVCFEDRGQGSKVPQFERAPSTSKPITG